MKTQSSPQIKLRGIFKQMMEDGYYPVFEKTHIQFGLDDNIAVLEYDEDIVSVRLFFSIDEEAYEVFLEASNSTMIDTYAVKPAILNDMKNIMFSCEFMCDSIRDFKRFFPRAIDRLREALECHKAEMKKLFLASHMASATIPATDDSIAGIDKRHKILS